MEEVEVGAADGGAGDFEDDVAVFEGSRFGDVGWCQCVSVVYDKGREDIWGVARVD